MRRTTFYAFASAAALVMTGIPATAYAATGVNGNQKMIVIGGGNVGELNNLLGQMGGNFTFSGCDQFGVNGPSVNFPSMDIPSMDIPPMNIPGFGDSGIIIPGFDNPATPEQPDGNGSTEDGGKDETDDSTGDAFEAQVVKLVNEERAKAGLAPLTQDAAAGRAARTRSREIESSFSHTRPDGSSFSTALSAEGVRYSGTGENIAYGQNTPEQVMQGWMNSAGHRANILNGNFKSIGVGHYENAARVDYWTQLFFN